MLEMAKIELEFILDPVIFFEKGTTDRRSYISNRYRKANDEYLKSYDSKQESKQIMYLDANNLYGYTMAKFLPPSVFKWLVSKDFNLNKYTSNSSKGCILEVNLEYSWNSSYEVRELDHDCPLASHKTEIKRKILFECQLKNCDLCNLSVVNVKKLVPNVFDKESYVIHYEYLQLYLRLGLKLKEIHRVLEFNQSHPLKQNIEFNAQKKNRSRKTESM